MPHYCVCRIQSNREEVLSKKLRWTRNVRRALPFKTARAAHAVLKRRLGYVREITT